MNKATIDNNLMKIYITIFVIFISINNYGQEYYFVDAKNGLNVRSEGNLSSKKIAKIRFGALVEKIADTEEELIISDNDKQIKGKFVKIKYQKNYSTEESVEGYVFDGYLKKQVNNDLISITKIAKEKYKELLKGVSQENLKVKKISDVDAVKTILKDRVDWFRNTNESNGIKTITLDNGQKLSFDINSIDFSFTEYSGYYPEHDILVLEGGHGIDVCFSIKTGESELTIGNPTYIISSPKNRYRLNGYFGGQECISYFFQENENGQFEYVTLLDYKYGICTFKEFYWLNEKEFMYAIPNYEKDSENGINAYFKGKINDE